MKSQKTFDILVAVLVLTIAAFGFYYSYSYSAGEQGKNAGWEAVDQSDDVIVIVNGEKIAREQFEYYKKALNRNPQYHQYSDEEVLNKMIDRIVLYNEALSEGFEASDEEIDEQITQVKDALREDQTTSDVLKNYFAETGISEEEYWGEIVPEEYRRTIPINKLYESKREEFCYDVDDTDVLEKSFDAYWDAYTKDLVSKADIKKYG